MNKNISGKYLCQYEDKIRLIGYINAEFADASYWIVIAVNSIITSIPKDLLYVLNENRYRMRGLLPKDRLIFLIKFVEERIGDK